MVFQVTNSPFNQEQVELLNRLLPTLTDLQKLWLSGYLTAIQAQGAVQGEFIQSGAAQQAVAAPVPAISKEVTVLFGSQTGNSQKLAKKLSGKLEAAGFQVTLSGMNEFKPNTLKKIENLFIVVSTHGEGEPPDNALSFYEFLHSKRAPQLEGQRFSVLGLGDTSYEFFCQTGKDFDKRLEELGATRIASRADCDVDFEDVANAWISDVVSSLQAAGAPSGSATASIATVSGASEVESEYSRSNPFLSSVLENLNLNGRGSARETRHLELSLEGSNLQYEPGDCLGIYPLNIAPLVDELIHTMGWNPEERVPVSKNGDESTIKEALTRNFEITVLTKPLIEQLANVSGSEKLKALLASDEELKSYIKSRDLLDLVQQFELKGIGAKEFVSVLRRMPPRLYSISSSPKAYPDEVHLTIRKVEYELDGRQRYGVCSTYVAEQLQPGDTTPVFVQNNPNFKLPADTNAPIIMIGPGTGVAPFRAFLGEREEDGAEGKTWLFYGDQHFSTDFLYQVEWQRWLKDGVLTKMDVAFSRDSKEKVYVQHRLLEHSKEVYQWLQEGAYIYICGDEKHMAHDVHAALATILQQEGGLSQDAALEYLKQLQQQKRYQRDVY